MKTILRDKETLKRDLRIGFGGNPDTISASGEEMIEQIVTWALLNEWTDDGLVMSLRTLAQAILRTAERIA